MCKYCTKYVESVLAFAGDDFKLNKTAGCKDKWIKYRSWIMKGSGDKKAGIMIAEGVGNAVYFDINYCPICGKNLNEEEKRQKEIDDFTDELIVNRDSCCES